LLKCDEFLEAEENQRRAIAINPRYLDAYLNLGTVLRLQGRFEESVDTFREMLILQPNYIEAHAQLGVTLVKMGSLDEALESLNRAVELDANCKEAHRYLGIVFKQRGKSDEAAAAYRRALEIDPGYQEGWVGLGNVLSRQGKFEEATEAYRRALKVNPGDVVAYKGLMRIQEYSGMEGEVGSLEVLYSRKNISNKEKISLGYGLGALLEKQKKYKEGFSYIAEANALKRSAFEYARMSFPPSSSINTRALDARMTVPFLYWGCRDRERLLLSRYSQAIPGFLVPGS